MKQADLGRNLTTKRTRKREFLDEMSRVVPWAALVELVAAHAPEAKKGNTIKKWLKAPQGAQPKYWRREMPTKLAPFVEALDNALKADGHRPRHERRTARALHV